MVAALEEFAFVPKGRFGIERGTAAVLTIGFEVEILARSLHYAAANFAAAPVGMTV
jgi:hypothetical protein